MRFSRRLLTAATGCALAAATPVNQADINNIADLRDQLPFGNVVKPTRTRTVTETQTFFEIVDTVYMTKLQLVPTWVPVVEPVNTCDETKEISCAICRTMHACADFLFEEECTPCDAAPACVACQPARPAKEQPLPPVINLGVTCSLGLGRSVPCELVDGKGMRGPTYRFGEEE